MGGVNRNQAIYQYIGADPMNSSKSPWRKMSGAAVNISVANREHIYVVNSANKIYRWLSGAQSWKELPGSLKYVSVASVVSSAVPNDFYDPNRRCKVSLRTFHQKFMCAEQNGQIVANRDKASIWETFTSIPQSDGRVALLSYHGKYVCAESDGRFVANRDAVGPGEQFRMVSTGDGYGLQSHHGKYLCAEQNGRLVCNRAQISGWETFYPKMQL